ncbi:MAG: hypothetical protein ACP5XB_23545 [Isosphaeraceae bacterium]
MVNELFPAENRTLTPASHFDHRSSTPVDPKDVIERARRLTAGIKDPRKRPQVVMDDLNRMASQALPEDERFPVHYYEDGIDGFALALRIRQIVALEHWNGNTRFTMLDAIGLITKSKGDVRDAMSHADFDLKTVVQTFGLTEVRDTNLFATIDPLEPSEFLRVWLDEFAALALGVHTERARSEYIIAPLLAETQRRADHRVNVLPGVAFDVDKARGLTGFRGYLTARSREIYYVRGPILAVVEAKKEGLVAGLGQCAAEMMAIRLFNEREGTPVLAVFGCVTSGSIWRFLKLEGSTLYIDKLEYN